MYFDSACFPPLFALLSNIFTLLTNKTLEFSTLFKAVNIFICSTNLLVFPLLFLISYIFILKLFFFSGRTFFGVPLSIDLQATGSLNFIVGRGFYSVPF